MWEVILPTHFFILPTHFHTQHFHSVRVKSVLWEAYYMIHIISLIVEMKEKRLSVRCSLAEKGQSGLKSPLLIASCTYPCCATCTYLSLVANLGCCLVCVGLQSSSPWESTDLRVDDVVSSLMRDEQLQRRSSSCSWAVKACVCSGPWQCRQWTPSWGSGS